MEPYTIYSIKFGDNEYVGSTCHYQNRMKQHKNVTTCALVWSKLYTHLRKSGGWKDEYVSILEERVCDKDTALQLEQYYILSRKANLNAQCAHSCPFDELNKIKDGEDLNNKVFSKSIMDFTDEIKASRPKISAGSLKTYNSLLRSIYKGAFGAGDKPDATLFTKRYAKVLDYLSEKTANTRKTYLAALVAIAPTIEAYRNEMLSDIKKHTAETNKGEMTDKLEESAITTDEIRTITADLKQNADALLQKKTHRVPDLMEIQEYVLLSLYNGHVVPRRALDYVAMKYQNYNKKTENYVDLNKDLFVFNVFKTAQKNGEDLKGTQVLEIPPSLKKILTKWIAVIPSEVDTLLFNGNLEPLSAVSLNQRLNKIFGGAKSVNSLRHFYLTSKYKELMEETEKMSADMEAMGSSAAQAKTYIKIHDKE